MDVHRMLSEGGHSFSYLPSGWLQPIQSGARIHHGAMISGCSAVAAGADVGEGADLKNVIVWPDAKVEARVSLRDAVVTPKGVSQCHCASSSVGA
jgi:NDP-sugar pyrophosphorylase family protein